MKSQRIVSLFVALACILSVLTACAEGGADAQKSQESTAGSSESSTASSQSDHPVITMNAPYRNMSLFSDMVHEKYPEINLEIIPYNGQNTSAYMKDMRVSGELPDIYSTTYYTPGRYDDENDFLDLSAYDFTDNFTQSRLREVTYNGGIYMLPMTYNAIGITYNKTLLDKNGWKLPTNLEELAALKSQVEDAGCVFSRCQLEFPGYGFQFLCNIADTDFLSTIEGLSWQEAFRKGETTVADTPEMIKSIRLLDRWRDIGMLNAEGTPNNDTETKSFVAEGNTLFLIGNSNDLLTRTNASDTYRLMPYLSEDGSQNVFILNVSRFIGLNKHLADEGSEQKLEDALHVMELISTVEGMQALEPTQTSSLLLPLKDWVIDDDSYYADVVDELNSGHTANFIYSGWENFAVVLGEKVIDFIKGNADTDDIIQCMDENQHLLTDDTAVHYTTATEVIDLEDCAKLVGICFGKATDAEAALVSVNTWNYNPDSKYMDDAGVSGELFPMPIGDEELTSILPTGWRGNIETVTLTGARIKELAETGYDYYGNGSNFPYVLVTKGGEELDDNKMYTIPICGVTDAVAEEGRLQDSGILGLDAARAYFSQFETLSIKDIVWE